MYLLIIGTVETETVLQKLRIKPHVNINVPN